MSAPAIDLAQLENAAQRTEHLRQEAAEAERSAYVRWQEAFAAGDRPMTRGARSGKGACKPPPGRAPCPTHLCRQESKS